MPDQAVKKQFRPEAEELKLLFLLELELVRDRRVPLWMLLLEILHVSLAVCDHGEETPAGMPILVVLFEMFRQFLDFRGQKGDLNF